MRDASAPLLQVRTSHASACGPRARNEDFVGMVTPGEPALSAKGMLAALADGVSGNAGGREAAEYTVRGLLSDYYATPDTWAVSQALDKVLQALNQWVQHQAGQRAELAGMATTLSALVLRGRFYYFAHVGDSRLYLLRQGYLQLLTCDHVWDRPEMQHVLTRAVGLDKHLILDHGSGPLQSGDIFILVSDGIWAYTQTADWLPLLNNPISADSAQSLVQLALSQGGQDNASAIVMQVQSTGAENLRDALCSNALLPLPPRLKTGQVLDGCLVMEVLHQSAHSLLYLVQPPSVNGIEAAPLVLKTLAPHCQSEAERSAFAYEEWLAKRVVARFFPQVVDGLEKNYLYYLSTWHPGRDLQQMLDADYHFTVPELLNLATQLVRAVAALHRRNIVHRDIKPANLHLGKDGQLRILDLGVARAGLDEGQIDPAPQAGTPSFLAPEQFAPSFSPASRATDIYALGVTLYHLLTRHYPYGEVEAFQQARFKQVTAPGRYRPDLPVWLENVLLKALAIEPKQRFETAEEMLLALERGPGGELAAPARQPVATTHPLALWQILCAASLLLNMILLYYLLR